MITLLFKEIIIQWLQEDMRIATGIYFEHNIITDCRDNVFQIKAEILILNGVELKDVTLSMPIKEQTKVKKLIL
jgi:hypothetical protein